MRKVPFFDYPYVFRSYENQLIDLVRDVGRRGAFIMQSDLSDFEMELAKFTGSKFAIGVGNATDAMEMFLSAAGVGNGDEVLICSHTMIATASAVVAVGAMPVPVDTAEDHLMDIESATASITSRTKGIMPTQLNGRTCNMDKIRDLAQANNLLVFEDSAQALGSKFKGKSAGTFGVAGCISFYPAKVLGSLGDGGAILCDDDDMYQELMMARDHGRSPDGDITLWGRNSRLDNLQAAILNFFLKDYDEVITRRREIAASYDGRLREISSLKLPAPPESDPDHFDIFQNYEIQADRRDELKQWLKDRGIGTLVQWGGVAVHQFRNLGFTQKLPKTDALFRRAIMLPMNMSLSDEDVEYVCESISDFYSN